MTTIEQYKQIFSNDYCGFDEFFKKVLSPLFGDRIERRNEDLLASGQYSEKADNLNIKKMNYVAQVEAFAPINVIDITVDNSCHLERSRVYIKELVRQMLANYEQAFIIFHYAEAEGKPWRFSYIFKEGRQTDVTAPKRFTYIFGREYSGRTAAERFATLKGKEMQSAEDFKNAFSVETLSDEFFYKYRAIYANWVQYITGKRMVKKGDKWEENTIHEPNETLYNAFNRNDKRIRDYIKKTLGRITFLYFVQRKGWLNGSSNFLRQLFTNTKYQDDFLDRVLEPLFYTILNTAPANRKAAFEQHNANINHEKEVEWDVNLLDQWKDIPFLNGGLFERDEDDKVRTKLPAIFFSNSNGVENYANKKKDVIPGLDYKWEQMPGLLDFFEQYNFTIDENDPDDAEVGVDPEMLGRIFENLLEDNKDKGAFYTPKEIVSYMCRESLIAYLQTGIEDEPTKEAIRQFVTTHQIQEHLPANTNQLLKDVKICDPAIGSGAFPMGLLKELFLCRTALEGNQQGNAEIKKHIIQQNIYGVDIERGAVDIARLRFWLSLIVDEETPQALPNLDYKIMQGNSLLEQFMGFDLSNLLPPKTQLGCIAFDEETTQQVLLNEKLHRYYTVDKHSEKEELRSSINTIVKQLVKLRTEGRKDIYNAIAKLDIAANDQFFLWHTWFHDVFSRPSKEGFDIVIGNPPYLESRSPNFPESLKVSLQSEIQKRRKSDSGAFPRGADLLIFFYELSLRLLNPNGYNVFITENSWLSTDYGKLFQHFLLKKCEVHAIIDSEYKYFETADINTIITIIRNRNENNDSLPVKFFHCEGSLEKYPCNTISIHETENISIKSFSSNDGLLHNYKWGVIIRAEHKLLRIIETIGKFEEKSLSSKISIGQGLNLAKSHVVYNYSPQTYPYYTSEIGPTYSWNNSSCYVCKDDISSSRRRPLLIMPRGIGTHFCSINECSGYTSSYVEVYGDLSQEETLNIWLFCNSSLFWLLREITGRTNLGGGMLKAEATDLKSIPICYNFNRPSEILALYMALKNKVIDTNISITINDNQHKMIDAIVLKFFGLDNEESYIVSTLQDMVFRRLKKSKTN